MTVRRARIFVRWVLTGVALLSSAPACAVEWTYALSSGTKTFLQGILQDPSANAASLSLQYERNDPQEIERQNIARRELNKHGSSRFLVEDIRAFS